MIRPARRGMSPLHRAGFVVAVGGALTLLAAAGVAPSHGRSAPDAAQAKPVHLVARTAPDGSAPAIDTAKSTSASARRATAEIEATAAARADRLARAAAAAKAAKARVAAAARARAAARPSTTGTHNAAPVSPAHPNVTTKKAAPKKHTSPPNGTDGSGIAYSVLSTLNSERATHGLALLHMNSELINSAHRHNLTMAADNLMSHQCKDEPSFTTRISEAGYNWRAAGENIGWNGVMNTSGALQLEYTMYDEKAPNDGHRLNILSNTYRDIGIDVWFDNVNHKLWLTEDFGAPA